MELNLHTKRKKKMELSRFAIASDKGDRSNNKIMKSRSSGSKEKPWHKKGQDRPFPKRSKWKS